MLSDMSPDAVVLAGGSATRLGGIDKVMLPVAAGGSSLLAAAVSACPGRVVVVGPTRIIDADCIFVPDTHPGGGPAAGIASGLVHTSSDYIVVLGGDQLVNASQVNAVVDAAQGADGAWAVGFAGNPNPMLMCVRREVLLDVLADGGVDASPLRLLRDRAMVGVAIADVADVDTWADAIQAARSQGAAMTDVWLRQLGEALGIDVSDVPVNALLDLTRDVAHGVERKAAPLSTFLLGVAVGSGAQSATAAVRIAREQVEQWSNEDDSQ